MGYRAESFRSVLNRARETVPNPTRVVLSGDLSHEHTMDHWRELWEPQIFNRQRLDRWEERGSKDVNAHLREITVGILDEYVVERLPDSVEKDIERILQDETATNL